MLDLPTTVSSVAAAIAGTVGIVWWWLRGAPGRSLKKKVKQINAMNARAEEARRNKDEKLYNEIMAERKRLLDSWVR